MKNRNKIIQFGEDVEGYKIPVLNEREIRASAGLLFLFMFISFMLIIFKENFLLIKYFIIIFLTDLIIRVFVSPKFSPFLIIGRLIVSRQTPEYVGAPQKEFAWKIGIALSVLMFLLLVIINSYSIFTGVTCLICLAFLFFESAFGICLGCLMYGWFRRGKTDYCAGEECEVTKKQPVQTIAQGQLVVLAGLILFVSLIIFFFNRQLNDKPRNLRELIGNNKGLTSFLNTGSTVNSVIEQSFLSKRFKKDRAYRFATTGIESPNFSSYSSYLLYLSRLCLHSSFSFQLETHNPLSYHRAPFTLVECTLHDTQPP